MGNTSREIEPALRNGDVTFEGANMIRLSIPRIALVLSLLIPVAGLCADDDVAWIADKSGCKVANPFPQPGESITWSGQCKNGVADGEGLLEWYINGNAAD